MARCENESFIVGNTPSNVSMEQTIADHSPMGNHPIFHFFATDKDAKRLGMSGSPHLITVGVVTEEMKTHNHGEIKLNGLIRRYPQEAEDLHDFLGVLNDQTEKELPGHPFTHDWTYVKARATYLTSARRN